MFLDCHSFSCLRRTWLDSVRYEVCVLVCHERMLKAESEGEEESGKDGLLNWCVCVCVCVWSGKL